MQLKLRNHKAPSNFRNPRPTLLPRRVILVLVGPTASGKTAVSLRLAGRLNGEIISADSRQIYKYLDIGTAKPTRDERGRIPHHFLDELKPGEDFNAGQFGERGRNIIDEIFGRGRLPIVVGGSGLYVRSLIDGIFEGPGADEEYRKILEERLQEEGLAGLLADLKRVDPESAERIDPTKPRRIIRALEVFRATGRPLSALHKEAAPAIDFQARQYGLALDRKILYDRIERRCDSMLACGFLSEVDGLEKRGFTDALNALKTVGYAEAFAYRRGEISYEEMVRLFKQKSRRYAKRQMTWFGRDTRIRWIDVVPDDTPSEIAQRIISDFSR